MQRKCNRERQGIMNDKDFDPYEHVVGLIKYKDYDKLRSILTDEFDINRGYDDGWTILHYAAEMFDLELIKIITNHPKVDLNSKTSKNSWTPMMVASQSSNSIALKHLLEKGADAAFVTDIGYSTLMAASETWDHKCVDILIEHDKDLIKLQHINGKNALMYGINHVNIVQRLIQYSDVSHVDKLGMTALHLASQSNLEAVKLIVEMKAIDIDAKSKYNLTPLDCAVYRKNFDIVEYLIEQGALFDFKTDTGKTVYTLAIELDKTEMFLTKYMLEIDLKSYDNSVGIPFFELLVCFNRLKVLKQYAIKYSEITSTSRSSSSVFTDPDDSFCETNLELFLDIAIDEIVRVKLNRIDCAKLLLSFAKNISDVRIIMERAVHDFKYFELAFKRLVQITTKEELVGEMPTIFDEVIRANNVMACKYILEQGADPNELSSAVDYIDDDDTQIAELLIRYGADVNKLDRFCSEPALNRAVYKGKLNFVKLLLKNGADPHFGKTPPIMNAVRMGHTEIFFELFEVDKNYKNYLMVNYKKMTIFLMACHLGNLDVVKALVERDVCLDDVDIERSNCLHLACKSNNNLDMILYLIEALGDKFIPMFLAKDTSCLRPLDYIIEIRSEFILQKLVAMKPELNQYIRFDLPVVIKEEDQQMCSICCEIFTEEDEATKLPCGHVYHKNCVSKWSICCPYCKSPFRKQKTPKIVG